MDDHEHTGVNTLALWRKCMRVLTALVCIQGWFYDAPFESITRDDVKVCVLSMQDLCTYTYIHTHKYTCMLMWSRCVFFYAKTMYVYIAAYIHTHKYTCICIWSRCVFFLCKTFLCKNNVCIYSCIHTHKYTCICIWSRCVFFLCKNNVCMYSCIHTYT